MDRGLWLRPARGPCAQRDWQRQMRFRVTVGIVWRGEFRRERLEETRPVCRGEWNELWTSCDFAGGLTETRAESPTSEATQLRGVGEGRRRRKVERRFRGESRREDSRRQARRTEPPRWNGRLMVGRTMASQRWYAGCTMVSTALGVMRGWRGGEEEEGEEEDEEEEDDDDDDEKRQRRDHGMARRRERDFPPAQPRSVQNRSIHRGDPRAPLAPPWITQQHHSPRLQHAAGRKTHERRRNC